MAASVIITAKQGYILHNGAGLYAYSVTVPEGVIWEEVEDLGQSEQSGVVDVEHEEVEG